MVGSSIYTVTSVLTQRELDHHCYVFNIPTELRPELPDGNSTIKDSPKGKIGMYTRFIEFANYRIPLSKFLLCILEYYQIHLSQLFVIGATKDPLSVDEAVGLPCVELLNENRTLIRKYPETFLCFVGLSRSFTDTDVHPTLLHDNDEEMGLLDFVKVISLSAQIVSLVDHNIHDKLNVNSGKRKKKAAFVSGSPLVKKARTEGIVISDTQTSTAGKSLTAMWRLIRLGEQVVAGSGTRPPTGRFVFLSSSSTNTDIPAASKVVSLVSSSPAGVRVPTTESAGDGHPVSALEFEIGTLSATPSHGSFADDFYESQTVDSATAMNVYVRNWNVTNNTRIDNPTICQNLLDHVTPPGYWAALRNQHDVSFLDVRDTEVADLKVKLERLESEAAEVEELRKCVSDLEALVAVKFGEVAGLTTQNAGLLERVSAVESERDSLKSQVVGEGKMREEFVMQQDAAERRFAERAAELDTRIADVGRDMDNDLYSHILTAITGRRWVIGHGFHLAVYKCARSVECCSALGKVISMAINKGIQQGLEAGIVHGKAGRSLTQVEAYDPEVEGKYVVAVSKFEGVLFPLLDEIESLKDSPLAQIMYALILKDNQGNRDAALEFPQFQPSVDQVVVLVYSESGFIEREMLLSDAIPAIRQSAERRGLCPPSSFTLGEASGSAPLVTSLGVTNY
ncbi:hypothetical protein Tco_0205335 [Tanacetum coccineum]